MSLTGIRWTLLNNGGLVETHNNHAIRSIWDVLCAVFQADLTQPLPLSSDHLDQLLVLHLSTQEKESVFSELWDLVSQHGSILLEVW